MRYMIWPMMTLLAACGGGGGGGAPVTTDPPRAPVTPGTPTTPGQPQSQMDVARAALIATYTNPTIYTALSDVPTSGGAVYSGYVAGQLANTSDSITDTLVGDLQMNVTFNATSVAVTGTISGFMDSDNDPLSGQMTLSRGSLDRGGNPAADATLLMTATGSLRDDAGRTLVIGTQLEGDFLGTRYDAVGGEMLGRVTVNGVDQDFDGGFIAER